MWKNLVFYMIKTNVWLCRCYNFKKMSPLSRDARDPVPFSNPAGFPNPGPEISRFWESLRISKNPGSKMIPTRDPGYFEISDIQKMISRNIFVIFTNCIFNPTRHNGPWVLWISQPIRKFCQTIHKRWCHECLSISQLRIKIPDLQIRNESRLKNIKV